MKIYIVFEYAEQVNKIIGIYKSKKQAKKTHLQSPTWRYIEEYIVHWCLLIKDNLMENDNERQDNTI